MTKLAYLVFGFLVCSLSRGDTVIIDDFEGGPTALEWSSDKVSVSPSGESFLGPFGVETVTAIVRLPEGTSHALVWFDTYAIGDGWSEGGIGYIARSWSPVTSQGHVILDASDLIGYDVSNIGTNTLGYAEGDRIYASGFGYQGGATQFCGSVPVQDHYTFEFTGQTGGIRWGLDNVRVHVFAIPEPSTITLLVIGAVGLLAYGWRRRVV